MENKPTEKKNKSTCSHAHTELQVCRIHTSWISWQLCPQGHFVTIDFNFVNALYCAIQWPQSLGSVLTFSTLWQMATFWSGTGSNRNHFQITARVLPCKLKSFCSIKVYAEVRYGNSLSQNNCLKFPAHCMCFPQLQIFRQRMACSHQHWMKNNNLCLDSFLKMTNYSKSCFKKVTFIFAVNLTS